MQQALSRHAEYYCELKVSPLPLLVQNNANTARREALGVLRLCSLQPLCSCAVPRAIAYVKYSFRTLYIPFNNIWFMHILCTITERKISVKQKL